MGKPGSPLAHSLSPSPFRDGIRDEMVAMLYQRNRIPLLIGIPFGLLVCAVAWPECDHAWLLGWFALKVAAAGARLVLDALYTRNRTPASAPRWRSRYIVALALDGLVWSLLILLFTGPTRSELSPVVIGAVIGVGSSGLVALSTDRRANAVFAIALLVPGATRLLFLGTRFGVFGGAAFVCFLVLIVEHGARAAAATEELLRLRFEVASARDAALDVGKAKGEFLATMSHELRTPLNAVIGMAGLLADTEMTPDQRERLDVIRASGETLLTLIGDVLDVSKIEAGKLEVEAAPLDLARTVEDALDQAFPAAAAKGLSIGYAMREDCPAAIVSDPTRVRQILANLLGNAVKFTARGRVTVRVSSATLDAERTEITFRVQDTGIGIEPESLDRLFVPFTQADPTTTRKYGGSGLGLAICKSLTELLGGTIGVESAPGKGSTFRFSIVGTPLPQSRLRALPINEGSRVCVMSDDEASRALLVDHVTNLGFDASAVASLAGALEAVATEAADVLLLDPRDDADATHAVRALREARSGLPIVLLVSPAAAGRRGAEPADLLVATASRPVKTGRLLEVIEALLAGQPAPVRQSSITDLEPRRSPLPANGSVLVVDDNELNRRVAVEMVRRLGLTARAVESGPLAIDAVRAERFDHVLMDVQMPVMDGFEATRKILGLPGGKKPRVIAMTANALPGDRERCVAAGMSDYITKPVRPGALAAALRRTYDGGRDGNSERSGITDVLDAQVLEDLRMLEETSGTTLLADLAETFRIDVPARIEEIRAAAIAGDAEGVRSLAHRLRGSAGAIGANRVFLTATELEAASRAMDPRTIVSLIDHLSKETARAIDAFGRVLERMQRDAGKTRDEE